MKVTITNKGEGFVDVRLDAETNVEALIMSTINEDTKRDGISLTLESPQGRESKVQFGYWSAPCLTLLRPKR